MKLINAFTIFDCNFDENARHQLCVDVGEGIVPNGRAHSRGHRPDVLTNRLSPTIHGHFLNGENGI
jgi:hypothetical protein